MIPHTSSPITEQATKTSAVLLLGGNNNDFYQALEQKLREQNVDAMVIDSTAYAPNPWTKSFDVVMIDIDHRMNQVTEHIRTIKTLYPNASITIISESTSPQLLRKLFRLKIQDYLFKPITLTNAIQHINNELYKIDTTEICANNSQLHWATLESIEEGILVVNSLGQVINYNSQFVKLWELPPDLVARQDDELLLAEVVSQLKEPEVFLEKVKRLYQSRKIEQDEIIFKDGRIFHRYTRPLLQNNALIGRLWAFRDISKRKHYEMEIEKYKNHLEELVFQRTSELEASNKELESFSYSVSHDLQTPLRAIEGFSSALQEDCEAILPDEHKSLLKRIRAAALKMSKQIDDLLDLSRLLRHELQRTEVNLSLIAEEVTKEINDAYPENKTRYHIQAGLLSNADPVLTKQLLANLIGNAYKFSQQTKNPLIEVGRCNDAGSFYVKDNGIGLDTKYAKKIFSPFQRLHTDPSFAGTGIGLATVQRIIQRHGGDINIESSPGHGACFKFSLNKK